MKNSENQCQKSKF